MLPQNADNLTDEEVVQLEKLLVQLHEEDRTDIYSIRSVHSPDNYAKSQKKQKIPASIRFKVWRRDGFVCAFCLDDQCNLTLDHVVPEEQGGDFSPENLVTSCPKCNNKKGNRDVLEFLNDPWLKTKVARNTQRISTTKATQAQSQLKTILQAMLLTIGKSS